MVMAKARWLDNNLQFPFLFSFFLIVLCFSVSPGSVSLCLYSSPIFCFFSLGLAVCTICCLRFRGFLFVLLGVFSSVPVHPPSVQPWFCLFIFSWLFCVFLFFSSSVFWVFLLWLFLGLASVVSSVVEAFLPFFSCASLLWLL